MRWLIRWSYLLGERYLEHFDRAEWSAVVRWPFAAVKDREDVRGGSSPTRASSWLVEGVSDFDAYLPDVMIVRDGLPRWKAAFGQQPAPLRDRGL